MEKGERYENGKMHMMMGEVYDGRGNTYRSGLFPLLLRKFQQVCLVRPYVLSIRLLLTHQTPLIHPSLRLLR